MKGIQSILNILTALLLFNVVNLTVAQEMPVVSEELQTFSDTYTQSTMQASNSTLNGEDLLSVNPLFPVLPPPNVEAHALWALGVNIGWAELGADRNIETSFLIASLSNALELANLVDCIPQVMINRIATLHSKMQTASNGKSLYSEILALRLDMAELVLSSCLCDGGSGIVPPPTSLCRPSDWEGTWNTNYNIMTLTLLKDGRLTGFYNTAKHPLTARPLAGNPCILEGKWEHAGSSSGRFRFEMTEDGKFKGKWTYGDKDPEAGGSKWTGTRQ
jgi:hypothetical protein